MGEKQRPGEPLTLTSEVGRSSWERGAARPVGTRERPRPSGSGRPAKRAVRRRERRVGGENRPAGEKTAADLRFAFLTGLAHNGKRGVKTQGGLKTRPGARSRPGPAALVSVARRDEDAASRQEIGPRGEKRRPILGLLFPLFLLWGPDSLTLTLTDLRRGVTARPREPERSGRRRGA